MNTDTVLHKGTSSFHRDNPIPTIWIHKILLTSTILLPFMVLEFHLFFCWKSLQPITKKYPHLVSTQRKTCKWSWWSFLLKSILKDWQLFNKKLKWIIWPWWWFSRVVWTIKLSSKYWMERTLCTHRKKIYNTVYNTIFALN